MSFPSLSHPHHSLCAFESVIRITKAFQQTKNITGMQGILSMALKIRCQMSCAVVKLQPSTGQ